MAGEALSQEEQLLVQDYIRKDLGLGEDVDVVGMDLEAVKSGIREKMGDGFLSVMAGADPNALPSDIMGKLKDGDLDALTQVGVGRGEAHLRISERVTAGTFWSTCLETNTYLHPWPNRSRFFHTRDTSEGKAPSSYTRRHGDRPGGWYDRSLGEGDLAASVAFDESSAEAEPAHAEPRLELTTLRESSQRPTH